MSSDHIDTDPELPAAIASPPKLLFVSRKLVMCEGLVCFIEILLFEDPLWAMLTFCILHPLCALLTKHDPYVVEVWEAFFRCKPTKSLRPVKVRRYVP